MCSRLSSNSLTFYCCMCALATVTYMSFSNNKCIKLFTILNKKINVYIFITTREPALSMTLKPTSSQATEMINGRRPKCNDKLRMGVLWVGVRYCALTSSSQELLGHHNKFGLQDLQGKETRNCKFHDPCWGVAM